MMVEPAACLVWMAECAHLLSPQPIKSRFQRILTFCTQALYLQISLFAQFVSGCKVSFLHLRFNICPFALRKSLQTLGGEKWAGRTHKHRPSCVGGATILTPIPNSPISQTCPPQQVSLRCKYQTHHSLSSGVQAP